MTLSSDGEMVFGQGLDEHHHAVGQAKTLRNISSLIEVGQNLALNVAETVNSNPYIHNVLTEKSRTPRDESYLISGNTLKDGERINFDQLKWVGFSRAGKVVFKNTAQKPEDPNDFNTQVLPMPNEMVCQNIQVQTDCVPAPNSLYLPDDPIWHQLGVTPPTNDAPPIPDLSGLDPELDAPLAPTEPKRRRFGESEAKYQARLKEYESNQAAYQAALKIYEAEKAKYEAEIQPYLDWVEKNKIAFEQLEAAIQDHNRKLQGREFYHFWINNVKERVEKEDVATDSVPAQILVGGNLTFSGNLTNNQSTILAGGTLQNSANPTLNIVNNDQWGKHIIEDFGTEQWTNTRWRGGLKRFHQRDWGRVNNYMHETRTDIPLNIVNTQAYSDYQKITQNRPLANGEVALNDTAIQTTFSHRPDFAHTHEIRSMGADSRLPSASLYKINPDAKSHVLIETDPEFTQHKRWLSSDYMFNALRVEPNQVQKRLGDGYYEQRLVREQIHQLTGKMFTGNQTDFDSQYKALMDAGITFAQKFNLRPGVSLTTEQVAQLTSDIVWFEPKVVTLADGRQQTVFAPRVYILAQKGDIDGKGSLLGAGKVALQNLGEIQNNGTIYGRELAALNATDIENRGTISGNITHLSANKLQNIGGVIEGEQATKVTAQEMALRSTTQNSDVTLDGYHRSQTHLNRQALIHTKNADGRLELSGKNLTMVGAKIQNDGNGLTHIHFTGDINLNALQVGVDERVGDGNHYRSQREQKAIVSHVSGNGEVIVRGGNIYSEGADFDAQTRLALLTENDIVLGTATRQTAYEEYHKTKSGSAVSRKTREQYNDEQTLTHKGTTLAASDIVLDANRITLTGTQGMALNNITVTAKEGLLLDAAVNQHDELAWASTKKSGVTASAQKGVASVGIGKQKAQTHENRAGESLLTTRLNAFGNLTLSVEKGDITANAAELNTRNDMTLSGKNVTLNALNTHEASHFNTYTKSSGIGTSLVYSPSQAFKANLGEQSAQGSAVGIIGQLFMTADALAKTTNQLLNPGGVYAYTQRHQVEKNQHQSNAKVTTANAGGNLKITATDGSITSQGAQLSAQGDGELWAKEGIHLGVAVSTSGQNARENRKGASIDMSKLSVGANADKNLGQGESRFEQASVLSFGGNASLTAQDGDIIFNGTQAVADGSFDVSAGHNITITTATHRTGMSESQTGHAWGDVMISDTERFNGYNRKLHSQNGEQVSHQQAMIASLNDSVSFNAGQDFSATSSKILAKARVEVDAEQVTFDTAHNTANNHHHSSDLKFGQFTRVISPIIDLVQSVESTLKDKEASDRVKAAQVLGLAAQGYILNNTVNNALNHKDNSVLFRVETGTGLAHSRQSGENRVSESLGNQVNAQHIHIEARSGKLSAIQTDFTSKDEQGKRLANSSVTLSGKEGVELLAGASTGYQRHKNQSYGTEVGTALSVGAKTGWSFYAKEGFQKGKQTSESTTYHNSHIDSETFTLNSGGGVTMKGATAHANSIHADIDGKLHIESLQDSHHSKSTQGGLNTKVEFGFGSSWEFSGNANLSGGKSNAGGVTEQSGLFAESGGYHITADKVELKGGAIASTNPDNSELTTNAITFSDIQNHSQHQATSGSLSGGYSQSNGVSGSPGMPMHSQGNDNSTTKATLTEGKITLNKDSTPTQTSAKELGINTDLSQANRQVEQPKDINQVLKEQQVLSKAAGNMLGAVSVYAEQKAKAADEEVKQSEAALQAAEKEGNSAKIREKQTVYAEAKARKESWEDGGANKRRMDAAVMAITTVLSGGNAGQTAVAALSPELNAQIHELTKDSKTANLLAHAALSALEAKANGTSATAGAIAGAAGEATAMLLSEAVFNKQPNELTNEERNLLKVAGQLAGAVSGNLASSTTADAVIGAETAKRAVENNYLSKQDWIDYKREIAACGDNQECIKGVKDEFSDINRANSENLKAACRLGGSSEACSEHTKVAQDGFDYARTNIQFDGSGWMAKIMNANKAEAKTKPTEGLLGSEAITRIENALSNPEIRNKVENDPIVKQELTKGIDQAASAVRTEKTNAYEFSAKLEYPNISVLSNDYKVFGRELGAEPVVPEYYVYSGLGLTKIGKNLFDLSSPSTRLIVGANGAVSAGSQYLASGEVSLKDTAKDMAEAYVTKDFSFKAYTAWNLGVGFLEGGLENAKWQDGKLQGFSLENGVEKAGVKTVTSTLGYGFGKGVENTLGKNINTYGNSLRTEPIREGSPITRFVEPSLVPVGIGNIFDGSTSKSLEMYWNNTKLLSGERNENSSK